MDALQQSASLPPPLFFPPLDPPTSAATAPYCPQSTLQPRIQHSLRDPVDNQNTNNNLILYLSSSSTSSSAFSSIYDEDEYEYDPNHSVLQKSKSYSTASGEGRIASSGGGGGGGATASSDSNNTSKDRAVIIVVSNMNLLRNLEYSTSIDDDDCIGLQQRATQPTTAAAVAVVQTSANAKEGDVVADNDGTTSLPLPIQQNSKQQLRQENSSISSSNNSSSTSNHWKMKRRQHHHRRKSAMLATEEDNHQGGKNDDVDSRATTPSSNLFLEMGDDEVGNHHQSSSPSIMNSGSTATPTTTSNSFCDMKSYSSAAPTTATATTTTTTTNSSSSSRSAENHHHSMDKMMTDNSSEIMSFQNDISLMGSSASTSTPGVVFHPHSVLMAEAEEAVGRSESTSICSSSYAAGTATTDEYNNNCYIRTPIRLMGEKMNSIGTTGGKVTTSNNTNTAGDSGGKETLLKSSPQSVMDKLMNSSVRGSSSSTDHVKVVMGSCGDTFSSNSSDGGGGDGGESLLHPPKNTKYSSSSLLLHPAYADNATDEYGTDESVAEEIVDIVDADEQVEKEEPNNLTKKIFSAAVSSIPLVDKFHDFITGNACWSPSSAAGGENGHGGGGGGIALLVPNAICADGDIMEMVDNVLPSSSSAKATTTMTTRRHKNNIVSKKKTKTKNRRNYDDDEEEDGSMDDEGYYDTTSNDEEETTTSYYTSDDSSRSYNRNHQHQKKNKPMAKKKKQGGGSSSTKKLSRPQDSPRRRRRGRSSTSKPGYNSDGESIRRVGSSGSRPRGMRPSSSSTSHTPSTADDDDDDADFRSGSRGTTRRTEKKNRVITSSSATDRIDKSGRGDGRRYSSSSDSSTSSGPEVLDTGSSAAGGSSIMESVLSYDQATWMSMTQAPGMMDSRNEIDASPEFCQLKDKSFGPDRSSKKVDAVEGYFKKILTVGIQIMLNDPPTVKGPQLNRKGKLLLEFGTRSNGRYEHPRLHWTDGHNVSHTFDLLDIESFRQPMLSEVDGTYRFAIPEHCFFLSTHSGTRLLFEAVDENEMTGITMALRDLICRFSRKIVTGENDWLVQLMLASVGDGGHVSTLAEVEEVLPMAVAEVTDHLVKKTTLIQRAQAMRSSRLRSRRDVM